MVSKGIDKRVCKGSKGRDEKGLDRSSLMFGETSSDGFKFCCLRISFLQVVFWNLNFQVEFNQKSWGIAYSGQITENVEKMMSAITLIWSSTGNIWGSAWFFGVTRRFSEIGVLQNLKLSIILSFTLFCQWGPGQCSFSFQWLRLCFNLVTPKNIFDVFDDFYLA